MFLISEPKCTWYLSPWFSSYSNCFCCSSFWTVLWCAQVLSPQRNVITAFPGTPGKGSCVFSVPHGQRGPGYAAHPASLWDQPDILGYQGSWETAHFPVMIKNVLELSKLIVLFFILVSGVWPLMWMFWHELWVEWIDHKAKIIPVSRRDWKLVEELLLRVLIKLHASFQCSLVCSICFCLLSWAQCSLSGNTKTCFSDKLLDSFSFFFFLPWSLNWTERVREIDFCFVLIFVLGKALTHNTQKAMQAVSHKGSTWCSCFWRDDSCFL